MLPALPCLCDRSEGPSIIPGCTFEASDLKLLTLTVTLTRTLTPTPTLALALTRSLADLAGGGSAAAALAVGEWVGAMSEAEQHGHRSPPRQPEPTLGEVPP